MDLIIFFHLSTLATSTHDSEISFTYVQGMNVLAAPFLFAMSEMEAFYAYSNLLKYCCPLYVQPTLQGVHCGIKVSEQQTLCPGGMILCDSGFGHEWFYRPMWLFVSHTQSR